MGAEIGADVKLERAPLKYAGLSYAEIWISEAQERMVLAVPPEKWAELQALAAAEDVEAVSLGEFVATGKLKHLIGSSQIVIVLFLMNKRRAFVKGCKLRIIAVKRLTWLNWRIVSI